MLRSLLSQPQPSHMQEIDSDEVITETLAVSNAVDRPYYLSNNSDVALAKIDPLLHFYLHGAAEGRLPNPWFTEGYIRSSLHQTSFYEQSIPNAYVDSGLYDKPRLIFVSHDASRTGAPAIILQLLELFSQGGAFECFSILDDGGERLSEFQALSHTHVMSRHRYDTTFSEEEATLELAALFDPNGLFKDNAPVCALVNSAESIRIARILAKTGVPIISLIHEIAAYYPSRIFTEFGNLSEKVVFPSEFVKDAAECFSDIQSDKIHVRGQGLLTDGFGSAERDNCRKLLREELGIEQDAVIVLNVGTMDLRKGGDLFVETAKICLQRLPEGSPLYFVWYGKSDVNLNYPHEIVQQYGLEEHIRFMPATPEIEQVFMGGDIFLLTARADPFPCVIHEAMACGLPVVAFRNGGGAPELIGDDCGQVVEMMNLKAMSDAIFIYMNDPEIRRTHARNAIAKIARSWDYRSYQNDLYTLMQSCVSAPKSGWPELLQPWSPEKLIIMHGSQSDLQTFEKLIDGSAGSLDIALINGRFDVDTESIAARLRQLEHRTRHFQPEEDTPEDRAAVVVKLLKQPNIREAVLVDVIQYILPSQLKTLDYPVHVVQTEMSPNDANLHLVLPYIASLTLKDGKKINLTFEEKNQKTKLSPKIHTIA